MKPLPQTPPFSTLQAALRDVESKLNLCDCGEAPTVVIQEGSYSVEVRIKCSSCKIFLGQSFSNYKHIEDESLLEDGSLYESTFKAMLRVAALWQLFRKT